MMVSFSGQKRSGKTLCMVKLAQIEQKKRPIMSSIPQLKVKHHKLKWEDFYTYKIDEKKSTPKKEVLKPVINWTFWKKNIKKGIYIDEIHNLVSHLNFATKESKCMKQWVSQVGKVQMDSGDWDALDNLRRCSNNYFNKHIWNLLTKEANFYFNSQRIGFIDKYFRDLTDVHINICKDKTNTVRINGKNYYYSWAFFYFCDADYSAIENYERGETPKKARFLLNPHFNMYGTHTITTDGEVYL